MWEGLPYRSPELKQFVINDKKGLLSFDFARNGMTSFGKPITDFEISGEDKIFYPATAIITEEGNIEVTSNKVSKPVAVRYAYKAWVQGSVYSGDGLPLSSFRTDSWDIP